MPKTVSRRRFLRDAALGAALGLGARTLGARDAEARTKGPSISGVGRIGQSIPETIPSPSDFGFAADASGGTFVCSMYGPDTGGFKGCNIMTVQGRVTPGTLQVHRGTASFSIEVAIFASPDVFTGSGNVILSIGPLPGTIEVKLGGPGKATMIMRIPDVTEAVGGNTGGVLALGRIQKTRIRS